MTTKTRCTECNAVSQDGVLQHASSCSALALHQLGETQILPSLSIQFDPPEEQKVFMDGITSSQGNLSPMVGLSFEQPPAIDEDLKRAFFNLIEKHFPKGKCKERGPAMVLVAEALMAVDAYTARKVQEARINELGRARHYLFNNVGQKSTYFIKRMAVLESGQEESKDG